MSKPAIIDRSPYRPHSAQFEADWQIAPGTQVISVTGMHRSGTSMLMRLMNLMGVEVGDHLVRALPNDNETGFWEHEHLVTLNEQLLEHFMSGHLQLPDLPPDYLDLPVTRHYQRKIFGIMRRDFVHAGCWGIKDPRIARLMALWQDTFRRLGAEPAWVIAVRHPAEVAASLVKRNGIPRDRALLLWLDYNLKAEFATRGCRRVFVHYPDVLEDWKGSLRRVSRLTGLTWPQTYEDAEKDVLLFLKPELRHQQATNADTLPDWAARAYHVLKEAARSNSGEVDAAVLDSIRDATGRIAAPLQEELERLREINARQTQDIEDLQRHMNLLFHSLSWQVTKPIRAVKKSVKWVLSAPEQQPEEKSS